VDLSALEKQLGTRRIDKESPIPYYYQVAQILRELIADMAEDEQQREVSLPSEADLCVIYQVNRGTVRHALQLLEREGLIYREKGRGTFVTRRRAQLDLTRLFSTTDELKARGWVPGSRLLSVASVVPRPHVRRQLGLAPGQAVWEVYRLRLANGEPIGLQRCYVPCHVAPDLDQCDLTGSLYYTLRDRYGVRLTSSDQVIRTRLATSEEASLLGIREGDPVFVIEGTERDQNGALVNHEHSVWRGDRYDLRVHLRSTSP